MYPHLSRALVAELVDAHDSNSCSKRVWVRFPPKAQVESQPIYVIGWDFFVLFFFVPLLPKLFTMNTILFLSRLGGSEMLLIIVAILLLFGGKKIPELMRGLGSGIKEFKNATKEDENGASTSEKKSE